MSVIEIIEKKRDGQELSPEEIEWLIKGYTAGKIPDYQMSAWCMAVYFQGMSAKETAALTKAMAHSGPVADLSSIPGVKVDKHSTGGVGDTVTLIAAPLAAAAGVPVAKMSGRSLGFTGGTVDKLESIPGYRTDISFPDFLKQVRTHGLAMIGQSMEACPADGLLYALRDATGTVESMPLIASSIMSKKIACGANAIVLDVKSGRGAFMKNRKQAEELMHTMVQLGKHAGIHVAAILTSMDIPLGMAIGNSLEVDEAVEVLSGRGGRRLRELAVLIAGAMIYVGKKAESLEEGKKLAAELLQNGAGLKKLAECIEAQHGDTSWIGKKPLTPVENTMTIKADREGFIEDIDPMALARTVMHMGGGRQTKDDKIDHHVGVLLLKEAGDFIKQGEELCILYGGHNKDLEPFAAMVKQAVKIGEKKNFPLVFAIEDSEG
jgi:pyrimidine-nucleoside phosphorylase